MKDKIIIDELSEDKPEEKKAPSLSLVAALAAAGSGLADGFKRYLSLGSGRISKHQMGKRGAKHNHRPTFHSRQIMPMSPAQYRRYHFGKANDERA